MPNCGRGFIFFLTINTSAAFCDNCAANIKTKNETTKSLARAYPAILRGACWRSSQQKSKIYNNLTKQLTKRREL